jgi:hypothetical protein
MNRVLAKTGPITPEKRARAEKMLRETELPQRFIAERVGLSQKAIGVIKRELGLGKRLVEQIN